MPLIGTDGAASAQGFGMFGARAAATYIEDVFSTYLYTGNSTSGGTQTITNGVDLSTKGGMVWIKGRSAAANNVLFDTARGAGTTASNNQAISSNLTTAEDLGASYDFLSAFNADGFTVKQGGTGTTTRGTNYNNVTYASWTFRKQAKFFDVVTYTGNGTANRAIAHSLTSTPGAIFIKRTDSARNWAVYHRSTTAYDYSLRLNTTDAAAQDNYFSAAPDSSYFYIDKSPGGDLNVNANGGTYVAYLFAHNAGGFGAAGTDNVISCGSYTGNGSATGPTISLGYEPQWIMIKNTTTGGLYYDWYIQDAIRGFGVDVETQGGGNLNANTDEAQESNFNFAMPTATGFKIISADNVANKNTDTFIYIAIRRGPMKTPTSGTSVFKPLASQDGNSSISTGFPVDLVIDRFEWRTFLGTYPTGNFWTYDRLRGVNALLNTTSTAAETSPGGGPQFYVSGFDSNTTLKIASSNPVNDYAVFWNFRRAPGFFDVVCYTGNSTAGRTVNHNLGVVPEMIIVKNRTSTFNWRVQQKDLGPTQVINLNATSAASTDSGSWNNTSPTASVFTVGTGFNINASGENYVAYLFATVAGVSKVGSYTGTGTTLQIDCGFTGGARFVLIKRSDDSGDWYVWDSARGIVAGNDPYLLLNSTAAEVTNTDYIDTYSAGFEISSTAPAAINANGGSFIYLAIA